MTAGKSFADFYCKKFSELFCAIKSLPGKKHMTRLGSCNCRDSASAPGSGKPNSFLFRLPVQFSVLHYIKNHAIFNIKIDKNSGSG